MKLFIGTNLIMPVVWYFVATDTIAKNFKEYTIIDILQTASVFEIMTLMVTGGITLIAGALV